MTDTTIAMSATDRRKGTNDVMAILAALSTELREVTKAQTVIASSHADHPKYCESKGRIDAANYDRTKKWRKRSDKATRSLHKTIWRGVIWVLGAETVAISFLVFFLITGHKP